MKFSIGNLTAKCSGASTERRKGEGGEVSERWDLDLQEDVVGARVEWRERFPSVAVILRNKSSEFRGVIQYGLARASNAYTNFHSERHSTLSKLQPFRVISSTERASLVRCITGRRWILISSFYDTVVAQIRAIKNSIPLENLWVHRWMSSIIDIRDIVIAVTSDRKSKTRCSLKFPSIPRYARFPNSMDFSTNQISFFRPGWRTTGNRCERTFDASTYRTSFSARVERGEKSTLLCSQKYRARGERERRRFPETF